MGTSYSQPLNYSGGSGSGISWSVTSGSDQLSNLGLSLSSDGVLSGSSPTAGSATFWAQVTDSLSDSAMTPLSVTINNSGQNVSGQIMLSGNNSCGRSVPLPLFTVSINYPSALTPTVTTTDSNGNYNFTGIPNGAYTITPTMTGDNLPEYLYYPSSSGVTVSNFDVMGQNYQVQLGYTVTGTVGYGGSATGPIYVEMTPSCGNNGAFERHQHQRAGPLHHPRRSARELHHQCVAR